MGLIPSRHILACCADLRWTTFSRALGGPTFTLMTTKGCATTHCYHGCASQGPLCHAWAETSGEGRMRGSQLLLVEAHRAASCAHWILPLFSPLSCSVLSL